MPSPSEDSQEPFPGVDDQPSPSGPTGGEGEASGDSGETRSLLEDIEYLVADARIWLDAEMSFQKSRAALVSNRLKIIVAAGILAALFGILALVGLTIGLIIALTPLITAWGATAVVVLLLLVLVWLMINRIAVAWQDIQSATRGESPPDELEE